MVVQESLFWNLIRIIWQRKKILLISFFVCMICTFIITTLMPKTYKASLTFIVNDESSGFNITSIISDLPFDLGGMGSSKTDKYLALLSSRKIRDILIDEFDLWNEYNVDYIELLYKALDKNIEVVDNLDNTISIKCMFDDSPEKALKMTKRLYEELYNFALELNKQKSKTYREYLERSLKDTYAALARLEDSLKVFQIENRIIKFDDQAEFSFQALAELETQNMIFKIEQSYLKESVSINNPDLIEVKKKLEAIRSTKEKLYNSGEEYIIAFNKMPELGLTYFRLYREIMVQQEILKYLIPIVQNARIEEKKETVNIQIIDEPFLPQYKVKPKRLTYMIIITGLLLMIELFYFALMDAYRKNKSEIDSWVSRG